LRTTFNVFRGRRTLLAFEQICDGFYGSGNFIPQRLVDVHFASSTGLYMKNGGGWNVCFEHFFQAHRLGGNLYVVIVPLLALAMFIFNREYRTVRVKFHNIATSTDAERI